MKNIKAFIYIALLIMFANRVDAQVDDVDFAVKTGVPKRVVHVAADYLKGTDATAFSDADRANYIFSWEFDDVTYTDTTPKMQYTFEELGVHSITFTAEERISGTTYSKNKAAELTASAEVPNVFTPNGDGINDLFIVPGDGITVYEMSIFSRAGMMVFERESPVITWDGRNKAGEEVSSGVYFYVLKALDGSIPEQKGFLHLYR